MPRAYRNYIPGQIWHITHRCHDKEPLLGFERDRQNWINWLSLARERFSLQVLNYIVTSNHIHLLVMDEEPGAISGSMQLVASQTAQDYNRRHNRKGAFWEDRYHATSIAGESHLMKCLIYIDLNMVRASVVRHPAEWAHSGYVELQQLSNGRRILARDRLRDLLSCPLERTLRIVRSQWIAEVLEAGNHKREPGWTESIAYGSKEHVQQTKALLEGTFYRRNFREIATDSAWMLKEDILPYE